MSAIGEIEAAMGEADKARARIGKNKATRVSSEDERESLRATALAWLRSHRLLLADYSDPADLDPIDQLHKGILAASEKRTLRARYLSDLREIKNALVALRSEIVLAGKATGRSTADTAPSFAPLVADRKMQMILVRRWQETIRCIEADAGLAATVMMGGLLKALLLARVNQLTDKKPVFTAKAAPRDKEAKTLPLSEWTLRYYIDVAHELGWITLPAKSVSEVLRDYRNYIHPQKELSHGVQLTQNDARMFWSVFKSVTNQVLASV